MDTYQSKFNDNLEYQSLISLLCPTKINEISLHLGDEKRTPSRYAGKESDILLTRVYNVRSDAGLFFAGGHIQLIGPGIRLNLPHGQELSAGGIAVL